MRTRSFLILIASMMFVPADHASAQCEKRGINLSYIPSWTTSWPFVDAFKIRRPWISGSADGNTWDDGRQIPMDSNGWVTSVLPDQRVHTLVYDNAQGHYPAGRYTVLYEGQGQLVVRGDAQVVSQEPGRMEVDITPSNTGLHVEIRATDPSDYIRNIRIIMPGFESTYQTNPFHPEFLDSLRTFDVIRFMDWQNTNGSWTHDWSMRPDPNGAGYSLGIGVPIEVMVELCNELDADPWFCMSHRYDDEYVENFASLVASTLEPERTVYVEHSNEVWNSIFPQYHDSVQKATALGIPGDDDFQRAMRYHSERSVEIFDMWDDHFSADRLVRVMGGWHANTWVTGQLLDWNNAHQNTDAYAVAPYFGGGLGVGNNPIQTLQMTPDEIVDACLESIASQRDITFAQHSTVNNYNNIELIAYESGQHMVGVGSWSNNPELTALLIEANRHPRMYEAYMADISGWYGLGGGLMTAFASCQTPSRYGSWGLLEYQDQPLSEAHKMRAWVDHESNPSDLDMDGSFNFIDVSMFISAFMNQFPIADFNEDQSFNFLDVSAFLTAAAMGCE
jgi:hypothetical protein